MRVFLLLLLVGFAGCSGPVEETSTNPETPNVITDPRDVKGSMKPGEHIHDYWAGRDRVSVLAAGGEAWSSCSSDCGSGMSAAWERPDEGVIVPQGTRWVNGTFNFARHADTTFTSLELWIKSARDETPQRVGAIQPGVPFSIESSQEQNDPPHYVLSLWQFEVVAFGSAGEVTLRGDYRWEVEAVRGLPLAAYPAHPDRWGGSTEMVLLEESGGALLYYEADGSRTCHSGLSRCPGLHILPDGVVVPADTRRVEVRVGGVPGLGFRYHGADTWGYKAVEGQKDGADTLFVIELASGEADSPYAPQSLWELVVQVDGPQPAPVPQAWTGAYTVKATAFK